MQTAEWLATTTNEKQTPVRQSSQVEAGGDNDDDDDDGWTEIEFPFRTSNRSEGYGS